MPFAIEVGLTPFDFWYGEMYLLNVCARAYKNKVAEQAKQNGLYTYIAFSTVIGEVFKKGEMPNYFERVAELEKAMECSIDKENVEIEVKETNNFWCKFKSKIEERR